MNVKQNLMPASLQQFVIIMKDHTLVNALPKDTD